MTLISASKDSAIARISEIVANLWNGTSGFQARLNPDEMRELCSSIMLKHSTPEEVMEISDRELTRIINDVMAFEAMSGLLDGLAPEQIEKFDAAVAGR
ncbi:MAG: hypothetical protein F6J93_03075 [Oscillatoria sp. SIO1A7]|nr:hypothetical protein [Oscillatoria sp. SIO1A7]